MLLPLLLQIQAAVLGTWAGPIEIQAPGASREMGQAILWIGTSGDKLVGCLGGSEDQEDPITAPTISGIDLKFETIVKSKTADFDLALAGGHLKGAGKISTNSGPITLSLDLVPAPGMHTLYETVFNLDKQLFDAFNGRNMSGVQSLFSRDLEFYHDRDGLTNYDQNMASFKKHFADSEVVRRQLETDTLEVYPVKDFGAIESGVHRFYTTQRGGKEQLSATAKFVHVWRNKDGIWQIVRAVSYDHR
jgi:hypothetical protein